MAENVEKTPAAQAAPRGKADTAPVQVAVRHESEELREHLFRWLDPILTGLGIVMIGLLIVQWTVTFAPGSRWPAVIEAAQQVIWVIFLVDFVVQLALAADKLHYLKTHWITAIAVVLPAFRGLRAFRAVRVLRSFNLLRLITTTNRAFRALNRIFAAHQLSYLITGTLLITLAASVGVYFFERDEPQANIKTFADALWWGACMITTINNEKFATSLEGRIIAVLLRLYAVSVFGYLTATIAAFFIKEQVRKEQAAAPTPERGPDSP